MTNLLFSNLVYENNKESISRKEIKQLFSLLDPHARKDVMKCSQRNNLPSSISFYSSNQCRLFEDRDVFFCACDLIDAYSLGTVLAFISRIKIIFVI